MLCFFASFFIVFINFVSFVFIKSSIVFFKNLVFCAFCATINVLKLDFLSFNLTTLIVYCVNKVNISTIIILRF